MILIQRHPVWFYLDCKFHMNSTKMRLPALFFIRLFFMFPLLPFTTETITYTVTINLLFIVLLFPFHKRISCKSYFMTPLSLFVFKEGYLSIFCRTSYPPN